jgi:ferredoxin
VTDDIPSVPTEIDDVNSTVRVVVDRSRCSGIGICESIAPEYFEVDSDGTNVQRRDVVADGDLEDVEEAVRSCPAAALYLTRI